MPQPPYWQYATEEDWRIAAAREKVIRPITEAARVTVAIADEAAAELKVSRSLIYRLVARFRRHPQTSSLLPQKRGRKPLFSLLPPATDQLIAAAIDEFYMRKQRPRIADLMREIRVRCQEQGCSVPNYRSIKRRIDRVDQRQQTQQRFGAAAARQQFGPVQSNAINAELPLEIVQIDHTSADVILVDEQLRRPIGRPWLTLVIDVASRSVIGFSVSLEPPSTVSVALALTHAVLPKDIWLANRELDLPWPMHGIPDSLHLDNAPEFHSQALQRAAQEYGIRLEFRPPDTPRYGGHIERLIGTTMGSVHLLPGTTFSSISDKGAYDPEKKAALTLLEFERWLALQIAGVYHQNVHSTLHISPTLAWQQGLSRRNRPVRQPRDTETFFIDFLPSEQRLIRRDGIQLFNIYYWDNVLSPLAGRSKKSALIKYDPRNLSRIHYFDDNGRYWPIPYRDLRRPPISLWEHRAALRQLRAEGRRLIDEKLIFDTVLAQRKLTETARQSTRERRNQERRYQVERMTPRQTASQSETPDYLNLPPYEVEEWG